MLDSEVRRQRRQADANGAIITATGAPANVNPDFQKKFNDAVQEGSDAVRARGLRHRERLPERLRGRKQDRASILNFLTTYDKPGVTKQIKFDDKGEVAGDAVYSYKVSRTARSPAIGTIK